MADGPAPRPDHVLIVPVDCCDALADWLDQHFPGWRSGALEPLRMAQWPAYALPMPAGGQAWVELQTAVDAAGLKVGDGARKGVARVVADRHEHEVEG